MKRLTVNKTWENCLAMWKWISRKCLKIDWPDVDRLKVEWLEANGYPDADIIHHHCFFCQHCQSGNHDGVECRCPAKKIDKDFYCFAVQHSYSGRPRDFYNELKRLNKIRLKG